MGFTYLPVLTAAALAQTAPVPDGETGSKACAGCHAEIYHKYSATGMARSSGRTGLDPFHESFDRAAFLDPVSGVNYRVKAASGGYRLEFERSGQDVRGERLLEWFIGSGSAGRSYLFSADGGLFQSPVLSRTGETSPATSGILKGSVAKETGCHRARRAYTWAIRDAKMEIPKYSRDLRPRAKGRHCGRNDPRLGSARWRWSSI